MCVLDASALIDNNEILTFLRSVLAPTERRAGQRRHAKDLRQITPVAQPPRTRPVSGIPLIVGIAVSITTAA